MATPAEPEKPVSHFSRAERSAQAAYGAYADQIKLAFQNGLAGQKTMSGDVGGNCGAIDQSAFASSTAGAPLLFHKAAASGSCRPGPNNLCLGNGRFSPVL